MTDDQLSEMRRRAQSMAAARRMSNQAGLPAPDEELLWIEAGVVTGDLTVDEAIDMILARFGSEPRLAP